jgi:hypothetical protein
MIWGRAVGTEGRAERKDRRGGIALVVVERSSNCERRGWMGGKIRENFRVVT